MIPLKAQPLTSTAIRIASRSKSRPRILTNQTRKGHPYLLQRADLLSGWEQVVAEGKDAASWSLRHFGWAWKMFRESRNYDAVVTGWDHSAIVFAILQGIFRWPRKCHIVVYTKWRVPELWLARQLRFMEYRILSRFVDRFLTLSCKQADTHSHLWHIPSEKFSVVPYYVTMDETPTMIAEGDYIFAGGDGERDYRTFLEAVDGLPCRVVIAALYRHHFLGLRIPANVEILTASRQKYFDLMAGARIVVVPLLAGAVRGGEQTYLNAMLLGKPTVVLEECGADEYITNGKTGIVLSCGDASGLRGALSRLLEDEAFRQALGQRGKSAAAEFTAKRYCDGLLKIVRECLDSTGLVRTHSESRGLSSGESK